MSFYIEHNKKSNNTQQENNKRIALNETTKITLKQRNYRVLSATIKDNNLTIHFILSIWYLGVDIPHSRCVRRSVRARQSCQCIIMI